MLGEELDGGVLVLADVCGVEQFRLLGHPALHLGGLEEELLRLQRQIELLAPLADRLQQLLPRRPQLLAPGLDGRLLRLAVLVNEALTVGQRGVDGRLVTGHFGLQFLVFLVQRLGRVQILAESLRPGRRLPLPDPLQLVVRLEVENVEAQSLFQFLATLL